MEYPSIYRKYDLSLQGRYEIISLSGSLEFPEGDSDYRRIGGLSVSLAGPDGRVIGGTVAGILTAATPVQVGLLELILIARNNEVKIKGK